MGSCSALATTPNNNSWLRVWSKITLSSNVTDRQTIDDIGRYIKRYVWWNNGRPTTTYKRHIKQARVGQLNTSQITSQTSGPRFLANVHTAIRLYFGILYPRPRNHLDQILTWYAHGRPIQLRAEHHLCRSSHSTLGTPILTFWGTFSGIVLQSFGQ